MDKKILIAGGAGVLGLVGILVVSRSRRAANNEPAQDANSFMSPIMYSAPPVSGGASSADGYPLPQAAGSNALGVSSEDELMGKYLANLSLENMARIQSNIYTADTSSLSGINFGLFGGGADVTHSGNNTSVNVKFNSDPNGVNSGAFIDQEYQTVFGRTADAGGKAYWLDVFNRGTSLNTIHDNIVNSKEAQSKNPKPVSTQSSANVSQTNSGNTGTSANNQTVGNVSQLSWLINQPSSQTQTVAPQKTTVSRTTNYKRAMFDME